MKKFLLSIIICTYNRANLLECCLTSLISQTIDPALYQIIIVDNNSSDKTQGIANKFSSKYPNVRIVTELNQGLSHARNRGWREAQSEYIAYIDDDAKAFPNWIEQIIKFTKRKPDVFVFGGPYYPFTLQDCPEWFPKDYGKFELDDHERSIHVKGEWICGSNMIFHHSVFSETLNFNPSLGMKGNEIAYGEETHLMLALSKQGYSIYYTPDIKVYHLIAEYKMRLKWLLMSEFKCGKGANKIFSFNHSLNYKFLILLRGFLYSIHLFFRYDKEPLKRRIYYSFRDFVYNLGVVVDKLF